jgi:hypothetical protein
MAFAPSTLDRFGSFRLRSAQCFGRGHRLRATRASSVPPSSTFRPQHLSCATLRCALRALGVRTGMMRRLTGPERTPAPPDAPTHPHNLCRATPSKVQTYMSSLASRWGSSDIRRRSLRDRVVLREEPSQRGTSCLGSSRCAIASRSRSNHDALARRDLDLTS